MHARDMTFLNGPSALHDSCAVAGAPLPSLPPFFMGMGQGCCAQTPRESEQKECIALLPTTLSSFLSA